VGVTACAGGRMGAADQPVLEVAGLTYVYPDGTPALAGVAFRAPLYCALGDAPWGAVA